MSVIDEMIIQVRVTAEGVKQGVAVAAGELKKLEAQKERLRQDLAFKLEASGVTRLNEDLKSLERQKRELEEQIRLTVDTEGVKNAKTAIRDIDAQKRQLQEELKFTVDSTEIDRIRNDLLQLTRQRREAEERLTIEVDASGITASRERLEELNDEIRSVNGEINLRMNSEGIRQASAELSNVESELQNARNASEETSRSMMKIGVTAAAVFAAIVSAAKTATEEFNTYTATMNGFASQMKHVSISAADAMDAIKEKTSDGLVSPADVAASIKNLTVYGFTLEQASIMADRLKDSAAYNRQAHYSLGEAIKVTTEGIKNENSTLADAAGVTKNIAKMYEDYADSLGKSANALTQSEKVQAVFNGVLTETEGALGNAAEYAKTLGGAQNKLASETKMLAVEYGSALAPSLQVVIGLLASLAGGAKDFTSQSKPLAAGLTGFLLGLAGIVAISGAYTLATTTMAGATAALGAALATAAPWAAAIGAVVAFTTVIVEHTKKQEELTKKTKEYQDLINSQTTDGNVEAKRAEIKAIEDDIKAIDDLMTKRNAEIEQLKSREKALGEYYDATVEANRADHLSAKALEEMMPLIEKYNIVITRNMSLEEIRASIQKKAEANLKTLKDAEQAYAEALRFTAEGMAKNIEETQDLISAYEKLSKGGELSAEELLKFSEMYPAVSKHISENINWRETLTDVIKKEAIASREAKLQEITDKKAVLEAEEKELRSLADLSTGRHQLAQQRLRDIAAEKTAREAEYKILKDSLDIQSNLGNETKSLSEKSKDLASSINSLESGYKALKDGQSLSLDTVLDLINNYPSLAHYIAETGDLTFKNGEMLKSVAKIKAETHLEELRLSKESVDNEITAAKNRATVFQREMSAKIDAFSAFYKVFNGGKEGGPTPINNAHIVEMEKQSKDLAAQMAATEKFIGSIDSFGAGSAKAAKESTKAQKDKNEALEKEIKLLEDKKALTQMSASDEIAELERIKAAYAKTAEEKQDIDKKTYALRLKLNDEWLDNEMKAIAKMNSGREESTDYSAIINKLEETLAEARIKYAEYPETLKKIEETLTDDLEAAYKDRAKKLLKIDSKSVDDRIKEQERLNAVEKGRQGITEDDNKIFTENQARYDLLVQNEKDLTDAQKQEMENRQKIIENTEIEGKRKLLLIETQRLEELQKKGAELTDDEKAEYESRMAQAKKYMEDIEDLTNGHLQKILDINKKAVDDQAKADKKAADDAIKALAAKIKEQEDIRKAANKIVIDDIKSRYAEEIKLAEAAANAEIKVYSDKIKAIDDLLKAESREEADSEQLDRINRLKEQLKFEKDDANIYELQKQIGQEQADFDKRKRREGLEDEKSTLQDKINAVKDNVADQKKALEELREAEIAYAEQSLEAYIAKLSNENAEKKIAVEAETEIIKKELGVQEVNNKTSIDKLYKQEEKGQKEKRTLLQQYTDKFVKDLNNKINDFADAGRKAGQAYAQAFREATESIMSAVNSSTGSSGSTSAATATAGNAVVQNITFTMPVATPSKVAAETAYALELMTRNI